MKPIFYFTLALFLGACGTKKQQVTRIVPKDTTPVVQKPTHEDTLKALALDPNDERYLPNTETTIETKEDGTQIITRKLLPKMSEEERQKYSKEIEEKYPSKPPKPDGGPTRTRTAPSEAKKAFMINYYASQEFQQDSLKFAQGMKTGNWKDRGLTEEQLENYIKQQIKTMKSNYERP